MLQEGVHPSRRNAHFFSHQKAAVRDQEAADVRADLHPRGKARQTPAILLDLRPGPLRKLRGPDVTSFRVFPATRGDGSEYPVRQFPQCRVHPSEKLEASGQEARRSAILEEGYLPIELLALLTEEACQGRVLDALDRNGEQLAFEQWRVERQRAVMEYGTARVPGAAEARPGRIGVGRADQQQEVESVGHFRQLPVHLPDGPDHRPAAERVVMRGPMRRLIERELEERAPERERQRAMSLPADEWVHFARVRAPVERAEFHPNHVAIKLTAFPGWENRGELRRRDPGRLCDFDFRRPFLDTDLPQLTFERLDGRMRGPASPGENAETGPGCAPILVVA